MKLAINNLLHRWGYHVANLKVRQHDLFANRDFADVYALSKDYTTTSLEALSAIHTIIRSLLEREVAGAFVNCAAWKAGCSIAAMEALVQAGQPNREIFAYDLFDQPDMSGTCYWNAADFEAVKASVYERAYPREMVHLIAGDMRQTIPTQAPTQIAFVQMDANRYEVTKHLLYELYPRISTGGCVFMTDYGSYFNDSGRATEEFLTTLSPRPLVHRVDHISRYWLKT